MDEKQKQITELKTKITNLESELQAAKRALFELTDVKEKVASDLPIGTSGTSNNVIEGVFNGENMIGPEEKVFPVPANYASKSKLVEGDHLKLTINNDGTFLFKQISPVERKHLMGTLMFENNAYHVTADGNSYNVLYASVTYHKAKPGDRVSIVIPAVGQSHWSVLESVIHELSEEDQIAAKKILEEKVAEEMKNQSIATDAPTISIDDSANTATPEPIQVEPSVSSEETSPGLTTLPSPAEPVSALTIDDMEIKGPEGAPVPDAVDPVSIPVQVQEQPAVLVNTDPRADAISEMEI